MHGRRDYPDQETRPHVRSVVRRLDHWLASIALLPCLSLSIFLTPDAARAQDAMPLPLEDHGRAAECLTLAIAYEAGYESVEGQQAVAEVVLNRLRNPAFPKTVCDVVFAGSNRRTGCQFTFTCDGSLSRKLSNRVMLAARTVAEDALAGRAPIRAPGATHYHADYVYPYWAPSLVRVTKIGAHIFYHPAGGRVIGSPGAEPVVARQGSAQGSSPALAAFAPWGLPSPSTPGR